MKQRVKKGRRGEINDRHWKIGKENRFLKRGKYFKKKKIHEKRNYRRNK